MPSMTGVLLGPGPLATAVTNPYSSSYLWKNGDYCTYNGKIYKFIGEDLSAGEAWTPAHWTVIKLTDEFDNKIDKNQGVANAGKALGINDQGMVALVPFSGDSMAIVINGDTALKAIAYGQYLFIKNHSTLATGGYHATTAIASGANITSSNVTADTNGIVNGAVSSLSDQIETLNNHFAPSLESPAYINTSIPLNSIGRTTFTGSSNDPLPDGSTSGTMLANYIRFGSGSTSNQRYGTLILNNNGETYIKARANNNAPYGTWNKVLYEEPFIQLKAYSATYSVNVGGSKNITATDFGVSTPTGYTPFAVAQYSSGSNFIIPRLINVRTTTSTVMTLYNVGSSAGSDVSASITIVYIKTSLISSN